MGMMDHHIGTIIRVQRMHKVEIKVMPDILQHVLEAAVFFECRFGHAPCEEGGRGYDISSD